MDIQKSTEELNKQVGVRLEPKLRYLAEVAADAKGFSTLTDYVKWAIERSFKDITLRRQQPIYDEQGSAITLDQTKEREADEAKSVANLADLIWHESVYMRLQSMSSVAPHLLSKNDAALLNYIHNRKDLRIEVKGTAHPFFGKGYTLDRARIDSDWESIKSEFAKTTKGKVN